MLRKPKDFQTEGSKVFYAAPASREAIKGWIGIAYGKVADSQRTENSNSTRLGAAYDAVFNLSLAVVNKDGWRTTSANGHHAQALEAAASYAGVTQAEFDRLDAIKDLRNDQYRGIEPSDNDVKAALDVMERMVPALIALLKDYQKG